MRETLNDVNPHRLSEFMSERGRSFALQSRGTNVGIIEFGTSEAEIDGELAASAGIGQSTLIPIHNPEGIWIRATNAGDQVNIIKY